MVKNFKRIISVLMLVVLFLGIFSVINIAEAVTLSDMAGQIDKFKQAGSQATVDTTTIETEFASLGKILTTIGAGVLIIVITYMGIKYFISSPEEQAKLKGQLIGVVVSGVVIFGAYSIWKMAVSIFSNM